MAVRFEERAPYERGFAAVFDEKLAPDLERLEARRLGLRRRGRLLFALSAGIGAVLGLALAQLAPDFLIGAMLFGLVFLMAAGIGLVFLFTSGDKWSEGLADTVVPVVCDFIGDLSFDREAAAGFPTERMRALGVIGGYDSVRLADRLDGRYRDVPFALVQAGLRQHYWDSGDDKRRTRTVWAGLFFRIGVPVQAPGRILIAQDDGDTLNALQRWLAGDDGRGMPRVAFDDDPAFEAAFEVHADDPAAAHRFLDPGFRAALLAIAETERDRPDDSGVTAAFEGDDFFLALRRRGGFLSVGKIDRPVWTVTEDLHGVFDDIAVAYRIIDRLHGAGNDTGDDTAVPA